MEAAEQLALGLAQLGEALGQVDPHHRARAVRQLPHQPADEIAHRLHGAPGQQGEQTEKTDHQAAFECFHLQLQAVG
ncbi:hypothetical protein D9M69_732900 [compost metagenome]